MNAAVDSTSLRRRCDAPDVGSNQNEEKERNADLSIFTSGCSQGIHHNSETGWKLTSKQLAISHCKWS